MVVYLLYRWDGYEDAVAYVVKTVEEAKKWVAFSPASRFYEPMEVWDHVPSY